MAIYYKFKSAKAYDTISMDGPFISVGFLKEKIYETKHLGSGKDLDIVISNAQTNEEYLDEAMLIPKNTSVLIRRVPGRPRIRVINQQEPRAEEKVENVQSLQTDVNNHKTADASAAEDEFDEFGNDFYSVPAAPAVNYSSNPCPDPAPADEKVDEETKLKALIDTPALDWQQQGADGYGGSGRGYGRGMPGRNGGRGFGNGMERKTAPPPGYICHRCNVPGHFIQHCPTNGDPTYDVKRVKPPTGIPKSMLVATPDGSYSLPSGAVAVLKPNEDAFEKEMEGLRSVTRSVGEIPPELKCPLCKEVMRDAALTSKCCYQSFCDKCIRDHIIAKSMCVCGDTNVLADDILPNKTLRDAINRIMESGNSSAENAGSMCHQVQDTESARCPPPKVLSPTTSAASKGDKRPAPSNNIETSPLKPPVEVAEITSARKASEEIVKVDKPVDASESLNGKDAAVSQVNTQAPKEETQQQVAPGDQGKRKKKKPRMPGPDMQWNPMQHPGGPEYMMPPPMGPGPSNHFFNGVQPGFNGFQPGFNGFHPGFNGFAGPYPGGMPPYVGYGLGPMDMYGGMMHPDPFAAAQGFGFPNIPPPHRDLAEMGNRMNVQRPPMMPGREEFEARKAEMKRKRENERRSEGGNVTREGEKSRMMNNNNNNNNSADSSSPMKPKSGHGPPPPIPDYDRRRRSERSSSERHSSKQRASSPSRVSSKKSEHDDRSRERRRDDDRSRERHRDDDQSRERHRDTDQSRERHRDSSDRKHRKRSEMPSSEPASEFVDNHKSGVFSRISFPEEASSGKQRKTSKSSPAPPETAAAAVSSTRRHSGRERESAEYESSDDEDRHFKRKPSRYHERSPSVADSDVGDEHFRRSKRSKGERWRA